MRWIIVLLVLCMGSVGAATMQESEPSQPVAAVDTNPYAMELTFNELGFTRLSLRGMIGSASMYIPFDRSWYFDHDVQLTLDYQVSPLLNDLSNMTVSVNGTPITSVALSGSSEYQSLNVTIPPELLQGAGMNIVVQGHLRITRELCESTTAPGQWVNILPTSKVSLSPSLTTQMPLLDDLPDNMLATSPTRQAVPLLLLLPGQADPETLTIAAKVARGLATMSSAPATYNVRAVYASEVNEELLMALRDSNVIMLGLPSNQPLLNTFTLPKGGMLRDGVFYTDDHQPVPDDHAVISIARSPWNPLRRVMVLSANQMAGLQKVGDVFAHRLTLDSLNGQYTFISTLLEQTDVTQLAAWEGEQTTFRQLGQFDRRREGLGVFNEYYSFYRPAGWVFEEGSKLHLKVFTSPAIKFSQGSYIAATMNDVPLGSYAITTDQTDLEFVFDIPPQINTGVNGEIPQLLNLRVELSHQFLAEACQDVDRAVGWMAISANSYITAAHTTASVPDLQVFPYPFAENATTIVLPDNPESYHVNAALNVAMMMGMFSPRSAEVSLTTTSALTDAQRAGHVIVLGERERQPLVDQYINNAVEFTGDELYTRLQNDPRGMLYTGASGESIYLLVFGANREGLEAAVRSLTVIPPPAITSSSLLAAAEEGQALRVVLGRPAEAVTTTEEGESVEATNVSDATTP